MKSFLGAVSLVLLFAVSVLSTTSTYADALIDPNLQDFQSGADPKLVERVLILVDNQGSAAGLTKPERYNRVQVVSYFKEAAKRAVTPLIESLQSKQVKGIRIHKVYWINGSILGAVTREGLKNLSMEPTVKKIYKVERIRRDPALQRPMPGLREQGPEEAYAFQAIELDRLLKEQPTITGKGSVVGVVDTGVDGSHPALQGKIAMFWDGKTQAPGEPKDYDEHGSHVSGTILGGDPKTNWIGVAPDAKEIMAGALIDYDTMLTAMQWFVDSNSPAANKVKAISNSWNSGGAPDQEPFYKAIGAWEASGILPVFSAGNAGPGNGTITQPHEYPGTFAVAAYGPDGKVASFSSRGPGNYKGQPSQKPDLAAPGVNINSSIPGGTYAKFSGTSMATPHVTGVVALMLQVNPNLNPAQIRTILVKSALNPPAGGGQAGVWNKEYGFGKLSAYGAVKMSATIASEMRSLAFNALSLFIKTPADITLEQFSKLSLGEVDGEVDQWQGDESAWIPAAKFFN